MNRQFTNALYLLLAGEIIVAAAIVFIVFLPMTQEIQDQRRTRGTIEGMYNERRQFLETIDRKRGELERKQADEKLLAVALPTHDAMEDVTRLIYRAAQTSGATVGDLQNTSINEQRDVTAQRAQGEGPSLPEDVVPFGLEIEASGTYQQMRVFMDQLEKAARIIDVQALEMKRNSESSEVLSASLSLRFYGHRTKISP